MPECRPETGIPGDLDVIGEPDERLAQPRHAELVEMQRFPEGPTQRENRDEGNHRQRR